MTDFEQLYNTYFNDVYLYIRRLSGDEHIAEEITSETFLKAIKSIDSFRGDCDVRVWLCQIAKNCYYSHLKKARKNVSINENEMFEIPDTAPGVEERCVTQDEIGRIHKVLHDIGEPYKEVFFLRAFGELSYAQIAELFSKTETWARVTFHRAKLKIQEELK